MAPAPDPVISDEELDSTAHSDPKGVKISAWKPPWQIKASKDDVNNLLNKLQSFKVEAEPMLPVPVSMRISDFSRDGILKFVFN